METLSNKKEEKLPFPFDLRKVEGGVQAELHVTNTRSLSKLCADEKEGMEWLRTEAKRIIKGE